MESKILTFHNMSVHEFVHLHVHTEYSLLDGAIKIDELLEQVKKISNASGSYY